MPDSVYKWFLYCRQTKIFGRGFQTVLSIFGLTRKGELKNRKTIEMFGYILRVVLQRIIFAAYKLDDQYDSRITLENYQAAAEQYLKELTATIDLWQRELRAF